MSEPREEFSDQIRDLVKRRELPDALAKCETAIGDWGKGEIHFAVALRGYVKWASRDILSALADYRIASILAPNWASHRYHLMRSYVSLSKYSEAFEEAASLIKLEKKRKSESFTRTALLHQLFCLAKMGRRDEFDRLALKVIGIEPIRIDSQEWTIDQMRRMLN